MLRQKPHVRFLEVFPVRAVGPYSRPPGQTSDTAPIGAELQRHGGERKNGGLNGCGGHCRTIRGGRNRAIDRRRPR